MIHMHTYKEMRTIITLKEKRLKIERETYPHEADKLFVTNSFIGFVIYILSRTLKLI